MKNVVHTVETRKIVDQHTHEIKCLDDRVQETHERYQGNKENQV